MKIERTKVEVVKLEEGYTLTLSKAEAQVILASLGKAKTTEIITYISETLKSNIDVADVAYKLYCDLGDVIAPSRWGS